MPVLLQRLSANPVPAMRNPRGTRRPRRRRRALRSMPTRGPRSPTTVFALPPTPDSRLPDRWATPMPELRAEEAVHLQLLWPPRPTRELDHRHRATVPALLPPQSPPHLSPMRTFHPLCPPRPCPAGPMDLLPLLHPTKCRVHCLWRGQTLRQGSGHRATDLLVVPIQAAPPPAGQARNQEALHRMRSHPISAHHHAAGASVRFVLPPGAREPRQLRRLRTPAPPGRTRRTRPPDLRPVLG